MKLGSRFCWRIIDNADLCSLFVLVNHYMMWKVVDWWMIIWHVWVSNNFYNTPAQFFSNDILVFLQNARLSYEPLITNVWYKDGGDLLGCSSLQGILTSYLVPSKFISERNTLLGSFVMVLWIPIASLSQNHLRVLDSTSSCWSLELLSTVSVIMTWVWLI